jgi:hypothetical protein
MKHIYTILFATILSIGATACVTKKPVKPVTTFAGVTSRATSASSSIAKAVEESTTIKKLQLESMSLLDRLEYKAVILLEE